MGSLTYPILLHPLRGHSEHHEQLPKDVDNDFLLWFRDLLLVVVIKSPNEAVELLEHPNDRVIVRTDIPCSLDRRQY